MGEVSGSFERIEITRVVEALIRSRRTVHRFDQTRPVAEEHLRRVLHLATLSPSDFELQPWRFAIIRDEGNRQKLRRCAFNQPSLIQAPVVVIVLGYLHPHRSHLDAMLETQREAGILTPPQVAEIRGRTLASMQNRPDPGLWATRSTMLAVATMMLAAESLGLSSALIDNIDVEAIKEFFGVPDDHTVCCLVAIGYAAETRPFPGRL